MPKGGSGKGGNAHDRAKIRANGGGNNAPPPLGRPDSQIPDSDPSSPWERIFTILENNWILAVTTLIAGFLGVIVDGRWFFLFSLPVALGIHRSKGIRDLSPGKQCVWYAVILMFSTAIFWETGLAMNKAREHFPTVQEIGDYLLGHLPKPQTAAAPVIPPTKLPLIARIQHTHIEFIKPPRITLDENGKPSVRLEYRNAGDFLVLNSSSQAKFVYTATGNGEGNEEFKNFIESAKFLDSGPPLSKEEFGFHDWRLDNADSYDGYPSLPSPNSFYLAGAVRWRDDSGLYETDFLARFDFNEQLWHYLSHNGEKNLSRKEWESKLR